MGPSIYRMSPEDATKAREAFERRWGPGHQAAFSAKGLFIIAGALLAVGVAMFTLAVLA